MTKRLDSDYRQNDGMVNSSKFVILNLFRIQYASNKFSL